MIKIIQALYFMLPAYIANMAPVFMKWLPMGDFPINKRIFGAHKTYRGLISGIFFGIITIILQKQLATSPAFQNISLIDYATLPISEILLLGFLFGSGALSGDLLKSFFKRRRGIAEGNPWVLFDQLDFVIGAVIFVSVVYRPPWIHIGIIVLLTPLLHLVINVIAYILRLKRVWW